MKNFFQVIVFFFFSLQVYSQEGEVIYGTIPKNIDQSNQFGKKLVREISLLHFSLKYRLNESYFENLPHVPFDDLSAKLALISAGSLNNWYQNLEEKISFFNINIASADYTVVYQDHMQGWQLENESKEIEGYQCFKASITILNTRTLENDIVEAWYTTDIPVPYGPAGYGGLPGLILELRHKGVILVAEEITLNPLKGIKPYPSPKVESQIDASEMVRLMRKARKVTPD